MLRNPIIGALTAILLLVAINLVWIDIIILALDGCWRSGANSQMIIDTLKYKTEKNKKRNKMGNWAKSLFGKEKCL